MSELYMGLMSGTSADGIDAAIVDLSEESKPCLLASHFHPYPDKLRKDILKLYQPGKNEINRLGKLDTKIGCEFGHAALTVIKKSGFTTQSITAIGSHGQTIRHHPQGPHAFTLQIGDPNHIAALTQITTVADFRRKDIALKGQGAPLVPAFHNAVFATSTKNRIILNIGGIANITVLDKNAAQTIMGYDTGPGNALLDAMAEKFLGKKQDEKGQWAASGKVHQQLLTHLLHDAYFERSFPKSTGREYFHLAWLEKFLSDHYSPADVQCTLTELTAMTIINAIQAHFDEAEIYVCGGGIHNHYLMSRLKALGPHYTIQSTESLGAHPDWIEAMAFAWLAKQTLTKKTANIASVTGASRSAILGGIYYA